MKDQIKLDATKADPKTEAELKVELARLRAELDAMQAAATPPAAPETAATPPPAPAALEAPKPTLDAPWKGGPAPRPGGLPPVQLGGKRGTTRAYAMSYSKFLLDEALWRLGIDPTDPANAGLVGVLFQRFVYLPTRKQRQLEAQTEAPREPLGQLSEEEEAGRPLIQKVQEQIEQIYQEAGLRGGQEGRLGKILDLIRKEGLGRHQVAERFGIRYEIIAWEQKAIAKYLKAWYERNPIKVSTRKK
jgi:hypothetical protein